ncbi:serine/threonine protein phosphatase 1 [Azospirillaceae bacterium]
MAQAVSSSERRSERMKGYSGPLPPGVRIYAVGDIHGRLDLLVRIQEMISADAAKLPAEVLRVLVFLGDYIDRGPDARGVVDRLMTMPLPGFKTLCLRGNHEETMLHFLEDLGAGAGWLAYGGVATMLSYGMRLPADLPPRQRLQSAQKMLREQLPVDHLHWLRGLPHYAELGGYIFVHAGIRPGVPLERQRDEDMVWIREEFLNSTADFGKVVVHGHTIAMQAESLPNRIGIDTGAYVTGHLTCVVLEGDRRRFIHT